MRRCPICRAETTAEFCAVDGTPTLLPTRATRDALGYRAGEVVGDRYRIVGPLGRGGFSAVYAAEHTGTKQPVALKVLTLDAGAASDDAVRRFFVEARVTAQLRAPNTVRLFDVGQDKDGSLYLAMERLDGPTLEAALRAVHASGGALSEAQAIDIAVPVLRSLQEAHARGLVHRDLKPANLILARSEMDDAPVVKVLDFGIARSQDSAQTQAGIALGTPAYMSPEQCEGLALDGRSDLYALGVVLWTCVCGRPPYQHESPLGLMYLHRHGTLPDLLTSARVPLSEAFRAALCKTLSKEAADRFADAAAMRAALQAIRQPDATASTPDGTPRPVTEREANPTVRLGPATPGASQHPQVESASSASLKSLRAQWEVDAAPGAAAAVVAPPARRAPWRFRFPAAAVALAAVAAAAWLASARRGAPPTTQIYAASAPSAAPALVAQPLAPPAPDASDASDAAAAAEPVAVVKQDVAEAESAKLRRQLAALEAAAGDPPAPAACRAKDVATLRGLVEARRLLAQGKPGANRAEDRKARTALTQDGAQDGESLALLAKAHLFAAQAPAAAVAAAARAVAACPRSALAHAVAGAAQLTQGQSAAAATELRAALELSPGYQAAAFNLGLAATRQGKPDEGIAQFDAILAKNPNYPGARAARGGAWIVAGQADRALADLQLVVAQDDRNAQAWFLLGTALDRLGRAQDKHQAFCRAAELGYAKARALCQPESD